MTPQNAADGDMPDFNDMSPEEAMAWLETLAKRQGVEEEQLTTDADAKIAEPPPDAVIDEPGYTPSYTSSVKKAEQAEKEAPPAPPEPATVAAPAADSVDEMEDSIMDDPMAWLETLAKQQGVEGEELTTEADADIVEPPPGVVVDEPGYTPFDPFGHAKARDTEPPRQLEPEPEEALPEPVETPDEGAPVAEEASPEDLMMSDPMAWLESLAKRQGVSDEELATAADLEIEEPPPDTVIDEPGYVPFDQLDAKQKALAEKATPKPEQKPQPPPVPVPVPDTVPDLPPAEPVVETTPLEPELEAEPTLSLEADDLFGDLEPAELPDWLKPAQTDDIPDFLDVDEPAPAPTLPTEAAAGDDLDWMAEAVPAEADTEEQGLEWLAGLEADDSAADIGFLSELDTPPPTETETPPAEVLDAVTDVASLQADPQAWLEKQMDTFVDHRADAEAEAAISEEVEPAVQGEVPDWLIEQMPSDVASPAEAAPEEEDAMPDWLNAIAEETTGEGMDTTSWLDALTEEAETIEPAEDWVPPPAPDPPAPAPESLPAQEDLPAGEPDSLPTWLSSAPAETAAPAEPDTSLDWLADAQAMAEAETEVDFATEDITAWLRQQEEAPLAAAPVEEADLSWLEEVAESEPVTPPPPTPEPVPTPTPSIITPVIERPQSVPVMQAVPVETPPPPLKIEASPEDIAEWLSKARVLKDEGNFDASMDGYEHLVLTEQNLDALSTDLEEIARQLATNVRVRRLLGDVYMRQNNLQQAVDTYRGALDQL